jgi:hypothetical protein
VSELCWGNLVGYWLGMAADLVDDDDLGATGIEKRNK